ncbi:hypothetical protein [Prosthecobacter sp.]|nr:hypothetical protein [Prosthecobacter sp.]
MKTRITSRANDKKNRRQHEADGGSRMRIGMDGVYQLDCAAAF